ncbi:MAG: ferritin family protein [Thermoplasmatota archaeon]
MDISSYTLEELLLAALKSEVESAAVYNQLAAKVNNGFLSDKLRFIAEEEDKHRDFLESIYRMNLQKEPILPSSTPVPLPEISISTPMVPASEIMYQAMNAEQSASDFYILLSERFEDPETQKMLRYLSQMEIGHYRLLELEKENLDAEEDYEVEWEMMHSGP